MTLHEEIIEILREAGREMTTKEISDKVTERGNYQKRDGSPMTPYQIHGRTSNYPKLFTRDGSKVGLVEWEEKTKSMKFMSLDKIDSDDIEIPTILRVKSPDKESVSFSLMEEMKNVLKDNLDELTTKVIADEINRRHQYEENEELPTTAGKVFLEAKNNPKTFEVNGDIVVLVEWDPDSQEFMEDYAVYGQSVTAEFEKKKSKAEKVSIDSYGIQNFKCFNTPQQFKVKPITLLFGPNSGGKSSLIHSILYLQNAFLAKELDTFYMQISGDSVDLGGFRQFIHKKDFQRSLNYSLNLNTNKFGEKVRELLTDTDDIEVKFEIRQPLKQKERKKVTRVEGTTIFYDELPTDEFIPTGKPKVKTFEILINDDPLLKISLRQNLIFRVDYLNQSNAVIRKLIEALILTNTTTSGVSASDWKAIEESMDEIVNELYSNDIDFIPKSLRKSKLSSEESSQNLTTISKDSRESDLIKSLKLTLPYSLSDIIESIYNVLEEEMKTLIYLGPIRSYPPRHLLPSNNNDPNWIAGGAAAWERLRDDKVVREKVNKWLETTEKLGTKYRIEVRKLVDLRSSDLEDKFFQAAQDIDFQLSELKEWDGEGGIVEKIKEKLSDEGSIEGVNDIALIDLNSNTAVTHRDVGFGLSQVIPVLVAAMANKNRIILIEQPEIHLHPALQAELGDVIIESALGENKNNLILENHSEHLMLRILRRIREISEGNAPNNLPKITPDDVQVIYVKPSKEGSVLYEIPITPDGDFAKRWPDGFFPERAEELMS